jgi:hypothetical protein
VTWRGAEEKRILAAKEKEKIELMPAAEVATTPPAGGELNDLHPEESEEGEPAAEVEAWEKPDDVTAEEAITPPPGGVAPMIVKEEQDDETAGAEEEAPGTQEESAEDQVREDGWEQPESEQAGDEEDGEMGEEPMDTAAPADDQAAAPDAEEATAEEASASPRQWAQEDIDPRVHLPPEFDVILRRARIDAEGADPDRPYDGTVDEYLCPWCTQGNVADKDNTFSPTAAGGDSVWSFWQHLMSGISDPPHAAAGYLALLSADPKWQSDATGKRKRKGKRRGRGAQKPIKKTAAQGEDEGRRSY